MMAFGHLLVHLHLLLHLARQVGHQIGADNLLNRLIGVELPQQDEIDVASAGSVQDFERLRGDDGAETRVTIDREEFEKFLIKFLIHDIVQYE